MRIRWHNQSWVDLRWRCPSGFRLTRGGQACERTAASQLPLLAAPHLIVLLLAACGGL